MVISGPKIAAVWSCTGAAFNLRYTSMIREWRATGALPSRAKNTSENLLFSYFSTRDKRIDEWAENERDDCRVFSAGAWRSQQYWPPNTSQLLFTEIRYNIYWHLGWWFSNGSPPNRSSSSQNNLYFFHRLSHLSIITGVPHLTGSLHCFLWWKYMVLEEALSSLHSSLVYFRSFYIV